jgi:hypothetical protein
MYNDDVRLYRKDTTSYYFYNIVFIMKKRKRIVKNNIAA